MANEYCRLLSNGFRFMHQDLVYQPCCWVPASPPINTAEELTYYRNDITDKVLANKEHYCKDCIRREKSKFNISMRQLAMNRIPEDSVDGDIVDLAIQVDTTCNAACTICGPYFSSLWSKQLNPTFQLVDVENKFQKLAQMLDLSKLRVINFLGGEPLVNDNHLIILNAIPHPKNVTISYTTNGSIFPDDKTLNLWRTMKGVDLVFSVDDIDDRFHYIRWPLDSDKVRNNIKQFANSGLVDKIMINCTINPMNIWYFDQLEEWTNRLSIEINQPIRLNISACYGTWGIDAIPLKLREKVIEKYGDGHQIVKLLSTIHTTDLTKWDLLVDNLKNLDAARKLSHQETFSEVFTILNS